MVSVFVLVVCCLLLVVFCFAARSDSWLKKLSTMSLEFRLSHRWLMGLKQTFIRRV